jgi:hypothetical protein
VKANTTFQLRLRIDEIKDYHFYLLNMKKRLVKNFDLNYCPLLEKYSVLSGKLLLILLASAYFNIY